MSSQFVADELRGFQQILLPHWGIELAAKVIADGINFSAKLALPEIVNRLFQRFCFDCRDRFSIDVRVDCFIRRVVLNQRPDASSCLRRRVQDSGRAGPNCGLCGILIEELLRPDLHRQHGPLQHV